MSKKYYNVNNNNKQIIKKMQKNNQNLANFDENKRFFVTEAFIGKVKIEGDEHNHLANVMRFKANDDVILICNDDYDYYGKIFEISKKFTIVDVQKKVKNISNPKIEVTAFVAVNKREPMSLMVRMLSELGVTNFVPITTKWTQGHDEIDKPERYQKIADQSAKQCRRSKTLKILQVQKLKEVCKTFNSYDVVLFAYEKEDKFSFEKCLENIDIKSLSHQKVAFLIGPVAGFDEDEAELIIKNGALSISLGKRILKADTACVAMATLIMNKFNV